MTARAAKRPARLIERNPDVFWEQVRAGIEQLQAQQNQGNRDGQVRR